MAHHGRSAQIEPSSDSMRQRPPVLVMTRAMDVLVPEASVTTASMRCPLAVPTIVHLLPSAKSTLPLT